MKECIQCGAVMDDQDPQCKYCGKVQNNKVESRSYDAQTQYEREQAGAVQDEPAKAEEQPQQQPQYQQPQYQAPRYDAQGNFQPPRYPDPPPYGQPGQPYQAPPYGQQPPQYQPPQYSQPVPYAQPYYDPTMYSDKNRIAAGILGILLGAFGAHKFYMGKIGLAILYLLLGISMIFTVIPAIIGLVEGIIYLTMSDDAFREKYCRLR